MESKRKFQETKPAALEGSPMITSDTLIKYREPDKKAIWALGIHGGALFHE